MPFSVMLDYSRNTILVYVLKKLILPKIEENQIERKQQCKWLGTIKM